MTSEMDEAWNEHRSAKKERKRQNLLHANSFGWKQHTLYHWYRFIDGSKLEYWPSTGKFAYRGRIMTGNVDAFIQSLSNEGKSND